MLPFCTLKCPDTRIKAARELSPSSCPTRLETEAGLLRPRTGKGPGRRNEDLAVALSRAVLKAQLAM